MLGLPLAHHAAELACQADNDIMLRKTYDQSIDEPQFRGGYPLRGSDNKPRRLMF